MNVRILVKINGGQFRSTKLNDAIKLAGFVFDASHNAAEVIVDCDTANEAAIRALITAHLATDWNAADAAEVQRAAGLDASINVSAIVQTLKPMDNAAFNAWWAANVTNLAQAGLILREVTKYIIRRL